MTLPLPRSQLGAQMDISGFELFQLAKDPQHLYVAAEARSKRERQERGMLSPQRGSVHVQNLPGELFPA